MTEGREAGRTLLRAGIGLFLLDGLGNVIHFGFHIYLGRVLLPLEFATVQTISALIVIVTTALGVMQPVVARLMAEGVARGDATLGAQAARHYFSRTGLAGMLAVLAIWSVRQPVATWLNVPAAAIGIVAPVVLFAAWQPIVAGALQGGQRFVGFGMMRLAYAAARFLLGVALVTAGFRDRGALAAFPLASSVALGLGLIWLGARQGWGMGATPGGTRLGGRWRPVVQAALATGAFTALLGLDLVWVNRSQFPEVTAIYAAAVLIRRLYLLFPGAIVVILYPRVIAAIAAGRLPDRLLLHAILQIVAVTACATAVFLAFGRELLDLTFGGAYAQAAPWLGWMGLAAVGYGVGAVWLNVFLASDPNPFIWMAILLTVLETTLFAARHANVTEILTTFTIVGWLLALGGAALYVAWLRPRLLSAHA